MGLLHHEKLVVGYDLGEKYSQVSCNAAEDYNVETLSSVAGEERYSIPTVLCKRVGVNQWYYGREALRCAEEEKGILVENIVQLALDGEPVQIDETTYDPVALLALFLKRSLGILARVSSPDRLFAMMITCERTDPRMIEVLGRAVGSMNLKTERVFFQSHMESFYNYMLHQPEELWKFQTLLLEYREDQIIAYRMECNRRTAPVVAFMEESAFPITSYEPMPESEPLRQEKLKRLDREFAGIAEQICSGAAASVYLIGEQYSEEWMKESLRLLCRGRRVFQGNNLYSKGACLSMLERLHPSEAGRNHVFLGSEKLKSNIGMQILRRGEESYLALLDAGVNWYEAEQTVEFYVQDCRALELQATSLVGGRTSVLEFPLDHLPEGSRRLRAHLYLTDESSLVMEVEDLGFGSFYPATQRVWREEFTI